MRLLCKLVATDPNNPNAKASFYDTVVSPFLTLEQQIDEDKKYGFLTPTDGILKYVLMNHDRELTKGEARQAINAAIMGWQVSTGIDFKEVSISSLPDITIQFLSSDEDQLFKDEPNVLAYMYYPISGSYKGTMVINSDYPWTENGEAKSGKWIREMTGKQVQNEDGIYMTWSLRKVVRHELGHGVYGLPHSHNIGNTMYYSYGGMSDFNTDEDDLRGQAKAGKPNRSNRFITYFRRWLRLKYS